jgi:hypothetical protein
MSIHPIATIPLMRDPALSIPFRVHVSADGRRMAVLNTYGMPYAQQLLVIDTASHAVVGRWSFGNDGAHPFYLDMQMTPDGERVVAVGGMLKDAGGQDFEPDCVLTRFDLKGGDPVSTPAGPVGFNYVSAAPDGRTAFVVYNGSEQDTAPAFKMIPVDLEAMRAQEPVPLQAPVNNVLYRPAEGRALVSVGRDVVSFDLESRTFGERVCPGFNHPYLLAAFSPDEDLIYAAFVASSLVIKTIDVKARQVVDQKAFSWGWTASTNIVPFGPDHLVFPPGSSAGAICLWNRRTGEIDAQAGLPAHLILSTPHPDGKHFILFDYEAQALQVVDASDVFAGARGAEAR